MRKSISIGLLFLISLYSCQEGNNYKTDIIPTPVSVNRLPHKDFVISDNTVFFANHIEEIRVAEFFSPKIKNATGYTIAVSSDPKTLNKHGCIELDLENNSNIRKEGYRLTVTPSKIRIQAGDQAGLFYGMTSLMQLLPPEIESSKMITNLSWRIKSVSIEDYPRFRYRGLHIDPCRHFKSADFIKKQLDVMSLYKINTLHLHLTDDQGWRMEIKKYPKLTETGASRIEGEGFEHFGYYTQKELKEIVEYASLRQITVIPEIEIPGHELAAISAYPHLSCTGQKVKPRIIWGVEDIVMCPGKEDMFTFLQDVIAEMVTIFPSEYYHIGGDECPSVYWDKCPLCLERKKKEGNLQSYVVRRVEDMLDDYGKKIIGWDEILEGGIAPSATIMSWRGEEGGIAAAMAGHNVIMTPASQGMYIDQYQGDYKIEPVAIGGYNTLEKVYQYNPVPDTLTKSQKTGYIIGVQTNTWSEYMYTPQIAEYRTYPRLLALSEIAWSQVERKNYEDFCHRIDNAYIRLDYHDINYHIPQPEQPFGSCNRVAFVDTVSLRFTTSRPIKIIYTLDGSIPDAHSSRYRKPISLKKTTSVKIRSILPSGKMSPIRTIEVVKEPLAPPLSLDTMFLARGLNMKVAQGMYLNSQELQAKHPKWRDTVITDLRTLSSLVKVTEQSVNIPQYAAIASGYIAIPSDGVYYFSSNNNEVSVDDNLIIDNNNEVKRFSRHDSSVALAAGLHKIEVMFLGHIIGGWPSNWDSAEVSIRKSDSPTFSPVSPKMLWKEK